MANIGNLAVQLTLNSTQLFPALQRAEKALTSASKRIGDTVKNLGAGMDIASRVYTKPLQTLGDVALGGMAKLAAQVPVVGGVLSLPFEALHTGFKTVISTYEEGSQLIKSLGEGAMKTNLPVEQFQLFATVAGNMETAAPALFKFQQAMGKAQLAAFGTKNSFTEMGFSMEEIAQLAAGDVNVAFGRVADKLNALGSAGTRARIIRDVFGRGGMALGPALTKGSAGVEKAGGFMEQFGLKVTQTDVDSIKKAGMAAKQLDMLKQGFTIQVTKGLAPFVAEIAERVGNLGVGFGGLADNIVQGIGTAGRHVAFFIDALRSLDSTWELLGAGFDAFVGVVLQGIGKIVQELPDVGRVLAAQFGPKLAAVVGVGAALPGAILGTAPGQGLGAGIMARGEGMVAEAQARMGALRAAMRAAGQTGAQDFWADFFGGVQARWQAVAKQMTATLSDTMRPAFDAIEKSLEGPGTKFAHQIGEVLRLQQMFAAKGEAMAGKDADLLARSAGVAFMALSASSQLQETRLPQALEGRTSAALSAIANIQPRESVQERAAAVLEDIRRQQEEQIKNGRELLEAVRAGAINLVGI